MQMSVLTRLIGYGYAYYAFSAVASSIETSRSLSPPFPSGVVVFFVPVSDT